MTGSVRDARRLLVALLLAALPILADPGAVARAAGLWSLAESGNPYFLPSHGGLLYLWTPIVVLSGICLVLAPGLVLALAFGDRNAGSWLLAALAWSTLVISLPVAILTGLGLWSPTGRGFVVLVLCLTAASFALVVPRLRKLEAGAAPWEGLANRHTLLASVLVPTLLLLGLTPKFYWEAFNGDGVHAYESARLLIHGPVPFWPASAGDVSHYPGLKTFISSYPVSWFIRLFGEVEAAARLPYLLFLIGLYGGVMAISDLDRKKGPTPLDRWIPWLGLSVFSVVMAFSAAYNPYHADIALPGAADTLCVAWFLGFAVASLTGRSGLAAALAGLTYGTSPHGLILLALWFGASLVVLRPLPWKALIVTGSVVAGCMLLEHIVPAVALAVGLPAPGEEHGTTTLAERLLSLQWRDWRRFLFVILPSGILPAMAVTAWWRHDRIARTIALVALGQFALFYLEARISLHYFVPAMVLPIAVLLRDPSLRSESPKRLLVSGAIVAATLAFYLSWPPDPRPRLRSRAIGSAIEDRVGGYDAMEGPAFARTKLLGELFPLPTGAGVPDSLYGGSPLEWWYYAHRGGASQPPAFVIIGANDPAPSGARLVARREGVALYLLDSQRWEALRAPEPGWTSIAPVYRISKRVLFHG